MTDSDEAPSRGLQTTHGDLEPRSVSPLLSTSSSLSDIETQSRPRAVEYKRDHASSFRPLRRRQSLPPATRPPERYSSLYSSSVSRIRVCTRAVFHCCWRQEKTCVR